MSSDDHHPPSAGGAPTLGARPPERDSPGSREASPDPLALLGRAGALLEPMPDAVSTLRAILNLLVSTLADYGCAYLRTQDTAAELHAYARTPEHASVLRALAPRSSLIAPLAAGGRTPGALALGTVEAGRPALRPCDLDVVVEIAARAGLALENARLGNEASAELDERQRAAEALRRERELLQRLIDTIPVMISVYRPDARVLRLNRAFERTLGWSSADAEDESLLEQCYPDPAYRAEVQRFMRSLEGGWRDFRMVAKDGRMVETSWANIRLSDDTQVGIGIDIGERKAAERERSRLYEAERRARDAAERLQVLAAGLSEAVSEAAVGEVVMRHGVRAVGAYAGVLALRAGEDELEVLASMGCPPEADMSPGRRLPAAAAMPIAESARSGRAVLVGSPAEWHERYASYEQSASGSRAWAALPVGCEARPRGALLWMYDGERAFPTEEREQLRVVARLCADALERARLYDAERHAREEAETANRVKSRFLGIMSHELRTPLNAVLGYADLLLMELKGPLGPEQKAQVERIRPSARVQLDLIEEILTYARVDAGREELRLTVVDVPGIVRDACEILRTQLEEKSLELRIAQREERVGIISDPAKLRQILLNLIGNAVKFTNVGRIEVRTERSEGGVEVHVSDTGAGIEADKLEMIFQPFMQVDQSTTRENGGTGLGLAIARRFARLLSGDVDVRSEPGTGSTFTLRLPLTVNSSTVRLATAAPDDP